jgi:hypothetical protein
MITFINRFYGIVNFEECVPDNSGWRSRCMEKTWGLVMSSLFWLCIDILWYNLYGIAVAAAMGAMIWRTIRAERRASRRQADGGQRQTQQSNTNVSIHTNSQRPISIINGKLQDEQHTLKTSKDKGQDHRRVMETESTTESKAKSTGEEKQKRSSRRSVSFKASKKSYKRSDRDESWTSTEDNETDSDPSYRPTTSTTSTRGRGRPRKATQGQQRMELDWEETNREDDIQERTHSASLKSTPKQPPVNAGASQTNTPTIDVTTLLQSVLAQRIQVNTQAPTNFPPPKKVDRSLNVHEWIRETQTTVLISDYEGRS